MVDLTPPRHIPTLPLWRTGLRLNFVGQPRPYGLRRLHGAQRLPLRSEYDCAMAESDRPQSPFAGMADFSARTPVRALSSGEIERMLSEHQLYLETEDRRGHRANFSSAELTGRDFSGLNLRGIKMDRAVLRGADFTGAHLQSANLVGAMCQEACFDRADLSRARLSGANLISASLENACLAKAEMEFALMAN